MTSPGSDENQPLLNNRVRREQVLVHVPVDEPEAQVLEDSESSHPIGQFRLFGSLLVDSIPGDYILFSS